MGEGGTKEEKIWKKDTYFPILDELFIPKTRLPGLSVGEDFVILARVVFTQCQRGTDGQTDIPIVANTGLCIASYADAL